MLEDERTWIDECCCTRNYSCSKSGGRRDVAVLLFIHLDSFSKLFDYLKFIFLTDEAIHSGSFTQNSSFNVYSITC